MDVIGRIAMIAIGAMFVVSGIYKLADGEAWPRQASDLGVGRRIAVVVPWFETGLGAVLILGIARPWTVIVAIGVLVVFTLFIARRLLDGTRPPCACFGSRSKRPLSRRHLARNGAYLAVAIVALAA